MSRQRARTDQVERLVVPNDAAVDAVSNIRGFLARYAGMESEWRQHEPAPARLRWQGLVEFLDMMLKGHSLPAIAVLSGRTHSEVLREFEELVILLREHGRVTSATPPGASPLLRRPWQKGDAVDAQEFARYLWRLRVSTPDAVFENFTYAPLDDMVCRRHRASMSAALVLRQAGRTCRGCLCKVPVNPPSANGDSQGRPREFCSNGCRQRAYRLRKAAAAAAERTEGEER